MRNLFTHTHPHNFFSPTQKKTQLWWRNIERTIAKCIFRCINRQTPAATTIRNFQGCDSSHKRKHNRFRREFAWRGVRKMNNERNFELAFNAVLFSSLSNKQRLIIHLNVSPFVLLLAWLMNGERVKVWIWKRFFWARQAKKKIT